MAVFANQLAVSPGEWKACSQEVIKAHIRPVRRLMAAVTILAVAAIVLVIVPMAGDALLGRIHVDLIYVAICASGVYVGTRQREVSLIVIVLGVFPLGFFMAIPAVLAQISLVLVVVFMTGETGLGRLAEHGITGMAVIAGRFAVTAQ